MAVHDGLLTLSKPLSFYQALGVPPPCCHPLQSFVTTRVALKTPCRMQVGKGGLLLHPSQLSAHSDAIDVHSHRQHRCHRRVPTARAKWHASGVYILEGNRVATVWQEVRPPCSALSACPCRCISNIPDDCARDNECWTGSFKVDGKQQSFSACQDNLHAIQARAWQHR